MDIQTASWVLRRTPQCRIFPWTSTSVVSYLERSISYYKCSSDTDSDSLPDEFHDDIHSTFIDLNDSNASLLLPQLVLPDSPHEGTGLIKASRELSSTSLNPTLDSFLSFTPAVSPVDSPILSLPSLRGDPGPAVQEGTSRHLDSIESQFDKELAGARERKDEKADESAKPEPPRDWREAVDNFIGESAESGPTSPA